MTEVPIIKNPVHKFTEQIISKIYTEPSMLLFSQFIGNLQLSWTKKLLVSTLNIKDGILCGDIIDERSKV